MTLEQLNAIPAPEAAIALQKCCGSTRWIDFLIQSRPFSTPAALHAAADRAWAQCTPEDGREAFTHHPKIGDIDQLAKKFATTHTWSEGEQSAVNAADRATLAALAAGNAAYEQKFGYIFIVCATGKTAAEMLAILEARLPNPPAEEIKIAMGEQLKITHIRLDKLLSEDSLP